MSQHGTLGSVSIRIAQEATYLRKTTASLSRISYITECFQDYTSRELPACSHEYQEKKKCSFNILIFAIHIEMFRNVFFI